MSIRIYVRASTKDQDATRALADLKRFAENYQRDIFTYIENDSGTKLDRIQLNKLLNDAEEDDLLLVESVDRLSRLTQDEFAILKQRIKDKGLRLIVADLPTTHNKVSDGMTGEILNVVNAMLIDLLATMSKLDNDKRRERIKQGIERSGYIATGRKPNKKKHERVKELLKNSTLTKQDIATLAKVGRTTVYRIAKQTGDLT